jgi:transmembrane sensor
MTDRSGGEDRPSREAADWMERLNKRAVDGRTVEDFYAWRRLPANGAAYARLEQLWGKAEPLGNDRDVVIALGEALRPRRWSERLRDAVPLSRPAIASALTVMLIMVAALFWTFQPISYETQVGEQRFVTLEDGSRVRLNTDSRFELRFSKRERRIDLDRGQAFFEVAHDRSRPFVVRIGNAQVTALGTRFDVRRENSDVRIVLAEGAVAVTDGNNPGPAPQRLMSGQAITLAPGRAARPEPIDVDVATAWTTGRTIFTDTPLEAAVAEVNRYTKRGILLDAPAFATAKVNGAFETGDVAAFVAAVTALFPLRAVADPDGRTRLLPSG